MDMAQSGDYGNRTSLTASEPRYPIFPLEIEDMIWLSMIECLPGRVFKYQAIDESWNSETSELKWRGASETGCSLTWNILHICRRSRALVLKTLGLDMWFGKIQMGQRLHLDQFFNMRKDILYVSGSTNIHSLYQWWFDLEKVRDTINVENLAINLRGDQESHMRSNTNQEELGRKFPRFLGDIFPNLKQLYFVVENMEESLDRHRELIAGGGKVFTRLLGWSPENYFHRGLVHGYGYLRQPPPDFIFTGRDLLDRKSQWMAYDDQPGARYPMIRLELIGE